MQGDNFMFNIVLQFFRKKAGSTGMISIRTIRPNQFRRKKINSKDLVTTYYQ